MHFKLKNISINLQSELQQDIFSLSQAFESDILIKDTDGGCSSVG